MTCTLSSTVIRSMSYSNGLLTLTYPNYTKLYEGVPVAVGYGLAYSACPLGYFNTHIKNKFKTKRI